MANRRWSEFVNGISSKLHPQGLMEQDYNQRLQSLKDMDDNKVSDYPHKSHGIYDEFAHLSDGKKGKRIVLDGKDGRELEYSKMNIFAKLFGYFVIILISINNLRGLGKK
jgi:hypothetical protein